MSGLRWQSIFSPIECCVNPRSSEEKPSKLSTPTNLSPQRISISDLSYPDGSEITASELSNSMPGSKLQIFTHEELRMITNNFCSTNYIGEGGFGAVYKGFVDDKVRSGLVEAQAVAVKVLDLEGDQGHKEWLAEVIFLGQLTHPHLVKLIGYCYEKDQRLLVYEYMERGNLERHLFMRFSAPLPWLTRIKIALGAAKGLAFLHNENKPVIFRDFKAANILLSADYTAKLSDFGFARDGPGEDKSHISTKNILGTKGYVAPEYIMTGHLTIMSDVYSFGVVLLELLTGRRSMDKARPKKQQSLVEWGRPSLKDPRKLEMIMDGVMEGHYSRQGAKKVALLAYRCLSRQAKGRPTMESVVKKLELVLEMKDDDDVDVVVPTFLYVAPNTEHNDAEKKIQQQLDDDDDVDVDIKKKKQTVKEEKETASSNRRKTTEKEIHETEAVVAGSHHLRGAHSDTELYKKDENTLVL